MEVTGTCILPGRGSGPILSTGQALSFWGCVDPASGRVSDRRHELFGQSVSGRVLAFPYGKGSSTGSLIILELLRLDLAPAAIVNIRTEPLLATGPVVGKHFYQKSFPIINVEETVFDKLETGLYAEIVSKKHLTSIHIEV